MKEYLKYAKNAKKNHEIFEFYICFKVWTGYFQMYANIWFMHLSN